MWWGPARQCMFTVDPLRRESTLCVASLEAAHRRRAVLHPLDGFAEFVARLLSLADVADQLLLEFMAVRLQDQMPLRPLGSEPSPAT